MFRNYWFAPGTPSFLVSLITKTQQDVAEFARQPMPDLVFDSSAVRQDPRQCLLLGIGCTDKEIDYKIVNEADT